MNLNSEKTPQELIQKLETNYPSNIQNTGAKKKIEE